jgi:hypothetical protein
MPPTLAGALVATALHDGRSRCADLDALAAEPASRLRETP